MLEAWWNNQPVIAMWGWLASIMAVWYAITFIMINDSVLQVEDAEHWFFEIGMVGGFYRWFMFQTWNMIKPEAFLMTQLFSGFTSTLSELELGYQDNLSALLYMSIAACALPFMWVFSMSFFALMWWLYCIFWLLDAIDWLLVLFDEDGGYQDPGFIQMLNKVRF